jgi:hypothetical protein
MNKRENSYTISHPYFKILHWAKFSPHQLNVDRLFDTIGCHCNSFNSTKLLTHYVLLTCRDFQPLSHICEHPTPPKPPDRVVIMTLSLKLSFVSYHRKTFGSKGLLYLMCFVTGVVGTWTCLCWRLIHLPFLTVANSHSTYFLMLS